MKQGKSSSHRFALGAVTLTYVAVTVGESILAPVLPMASPDLGLGEAEAGQILGVLSIAAGVGNLGGGFLLGRLGPRLSSMLGVALTAVGAGLASIEAAVGLFALAHVIMGLGAGIFFASGIYSVGALADPSRRGRAMGSFGIAYSLALALAAGLVAVVGPAAWRAVFGVAAALAIVAFVTLAFADLPAPTSPRSSDVRGGLRLLAVPVAVGGVAAVAQFGLVAFVPTFAVDEWAYSASLAAGILLVGRVLSIPGKAWAGRLSDRQGAIGAAHIVAIALVASGAVWLLSPVPLVGAVAATVFTAAASSMFPVANVVAVERFGDRGGLLGVFRSAQMVVAGVSAWLVGLGATTLGLRTVLGIGVATLAALLLVRQTEGPSSHKVT